MAIKSKDDLSRVNTACKFYRLAEIAQLEQLEVPIKKGR